jgi:hypothetical protein
LQEAKGEPEDGEEAADHHGEEVVHGPFEDGAQQEEEGPGEEEYASVYMCIASGDCHCQWGK